MSPRVTPDFSEAANTTPPTPGEYLCRILSSEIKTARDSGNQYVAWRLETVLEKRLVIYNTVLSGRGSWMFKHLVHCAGDDTYESGAYDTDGLKGQIVSMILSVENITNRHGDLVSVFRVEKVAEATLKQLQSLPQSAMAEDNSDIPF